MMTMMMTEAIDETDSRGIPIVSDIWHLCDDSYPDIIHRASFHRMTSRQLTEAITLMCGHCVKLSIA